MEGEAGVAIEAPNVDVTLPEASVDLDASGVLPSGQVQYEAPEAGGHFDVDAGASARPKVSALASRFNDIANNSRPSSNSPHSMVKADASWRSNSPLVHGKVDPAFDVDAGSVEDYYYSSPRVSLS